MATTATTVQKQRLSPAERALLFSQSTRQHFQALPAIGGAASGTVSFEIPKVKLTSRIFLLIRATINAVHASSTSYTPVWHGPFGFIRQVRVNYNGAFNPYTLSGQSLALANLLYDNALSVVPVVDAQATIAANWLRARNVLGTTAASGEGANNSLRCLIELPLMINERDPVGLVLTQNEETTVTVEIDFDAASAVCASPSEYTFTASAVSVLPVIEQFSLPAILDAIPDISSLRVCTEKFETIAGGGIYTVRLQPGPVYRKIAFRIEDASGGEVDADITGDIELILNAADSIYRLPAQVLAGINCRQYGLQAGLPQGCYVFDLTYQGTPNYGGMRDWIDAEKLTELWLRFNAAGAGSIRVMSDCLAKLRAA